MIDWENTHAQNIMSDLEEESDYDNDHEIGKSNNSIGIPSINTQNAQEIAEVFQYNIKEPKIDITALQVRKTTRERIFPFMKFTTEYILRQVKLRQENNIIHFLLQDLNRLDDNDKSRAKFWLTYKSEVKNTLTTRKTEVCNQMKEAVVQCK